MGAVHTGKIDAAKAELNTLNSIYDTLLKQKDSYKANHVLIQVKTAEAWIQLKEGKQIEALKLMNAATEMEDKTEKHPVTPGEIIPARELLGDMFLQMNKLEQALEAYEEDLKKHPNRFNAVYGAGLASERSGNREKAKLYYRQLLTFVNPENCNRPELTAINLFLKKK